MRRSSDASSVFQAGDRYIARPLGYIVALMSIITGEITFCTCRDEVTGHDAFGCTRQGCDCTQTQSQFEQQAAVLASLDYLGG